MRRVVLSLVVLLVCAVLSAEVQAAPVPPVVGIEQISLTVIPGQPHPPLEFPNHPDPTHPKTLIFEGFALPLNPTAGGTLTLQFDWLGLTGQEELSDPFTFPLNPAGTTVNARWVIPFCPRFVSLHFGTDQPVAVQGTFVHRCEVIPVPAAVWGGLVLMGLLAAVKLRRKLVPVAA